MDFALSEEQEMLKTMARNFLETECPEAKVREVDRGYKGYSPKLWKQVADLGWTGLIFPEKYGGSAGNLIDMAVLYEEMGRAMFPSPHLSTVILGGLLILNNGTEEQKQALLPKIASGKEIIAVAITEPDAAWDQCAWEPKGITLKATAQGDSFVINGTKLFVPDAHIADHIIIVARTKAGAGADGVTLFLVNAKDPAVKCTALVTSANDNKFCEVAINNLKVSKNDIIGQLDKGWDPLFKVMQVGAVMLCAEMVGAGQQALETTIDYAKTRVQFDMPIGIHQHVQEHCVQLVLSVDGSRRLTYFAAWKLAEGLDANLEVAMAKAWTNENHDNALWRAHQVLAGVSSTEALGVMPLFTKRGNIQQLYLGDSDFWREKVAEELEKLPEPEKGHAPALGLWKPGLPQVPSWDIWRDYVNSLKKIEVE